MSARICIIHTGGTLGMHNLSPINVKRRPEELRGDLLRNIPQLRGIADIDVQVAMNKDSSAMQVADWCEIGAAVWRDRERFDGFVIVHGTDTMVFTAAALSFMLRDFPLPVVLTGSQRPLSELRTDASRNLINSVDLVAPGCLREVGLFFD